MLGIAKGLFEITTLFYAISILLYYIDYLHRNKKAKTIAFYLLFIAWILQSTQFAAKVYELGYFPILSIKEGLFFYVWVIMGISLFLNRFVKIDFILFFINTFGFSLHTIYTFAPQQHTSSKLAYEMASELLIFHITLAFIAYATFAIGFVISGMYFMQYAKLKKKKWGEKLVRMGDLAKLEKNSYVANAVGASIYMVALIFGTVFAYFQLGNSFWLDPKFLGSVFVLVMYSVYLYLSYTKKIFGKNKVFWGVICFMTIPINYFLVGGFSNFHFIFM